MGAALNVCRSPEAYRVARPKKRFRAVLALLVCAGFFPGVCLAGEAQKSRFSIKVEPNSTTVTVVEGSVVVEDDKENTEIKGGFQAVLRKGRRFPIPREIDALTLVRWATDYLKTILPPLDEGLVGYWKFDEGVGSTTKDESQHGHHGTISGAKWVEGKVGKALEFDGSSARVDIGNPPALQLTGAMTLCAWILVDDYQENGRIVCKQNGPGERGWAINIERQKFARIQVPIDNNTTVGPQTPTLSVGQWYHIAGVYAPGKEIHMYLDGKLVGTLDQGVPAQQYNCPLPVRIGARPKNGCYFDGKIDEVRVYARALSAEEVKAIYLAAK